MRVLFSSTWGVGHVFPLVPLARAFAAAGHEVRWATYPQACGLVAAAGLEAVPVGPGVEGVRALEARIRDEVVDLAPQDRAAYMFPHMFAAGATPTVVDDLLAAARAFGPDLVVHEPAELAAPLVGTLLGVPHVTHSWGGAVPAPLVAAAGEALADLWAAHGLVVPPHAGCYEHAYVDLCPPSLPNPPLDHVRRRVPLAPGGYTGEATGPLPDLVTRSEDRPLVYLTLGTVMNRPPAFVPVVRGLADLPVRLLVTLGPTGDPATLGDLPDHVLAVPWVHQAGVLDHASLVVSHAGSGTNLSCLARGLAQLCLPQGADQFRNAAAVEAAGAGLALHPDVVDPAAVGDAAARLLADDGFRTAARRVAAEIAAMPQPAEVAAELAGMR